MTCAEHNRAHCLEPRCHVRAVCWASVPGFEGLSYPNTWSAWAWLQRHGYHTSRWKGSADMADRLVAWIRWPGALYYDPDRSPRADTEHPLDAVLPYEDRVAALASECPHRWCRNGRHPRPVSSTITTHTALTLDVEDIVTPCEHDGINWHTVAVLLDAMRDLGIGLDVVHEWRPEGCHYHSCAVQDGEECALGKMPHLRHECPYWGTAP